MIIKKQDIRILMMYFLFPAITIGLITFPQPSMRSSIFPQLIILFVILNALVIVLLEYRNVIFLSCLILCLVLSKGLSFVYGDFLGIYTLTLNLLICISSVAISLERPKIIYTQVMFICTLSFIFMIMQLIGVGAWTQVLTTHGPVAIEQRNMLFIKYFDLMNFYYDVIQVRPAGILHSNIMLSGMVLFGVSLHFSQPKGGRLLGTIILCGSIVIAMSKLLFFGSVIIFLVILFSGNRHQKFSIKEAIIILIIFFSLYSYLFPGLYSYNVNITTLLYSFDLRLNDVLQTMSKDNPLRLVAENYINTTHTALNYGTKSHVSGYSVLVKYFYFTIPFLLLFQLLYIKGYNKFRGIIGKMSMQNRTTLIVVIVYPLAFPIWGALLYGFIVGYALMPAFLSFLKPRIINRFYIKSDTIDDQARTQCGI
jgi:hypothetical protein